MAVAKRQGREKPTKIEHRNRSEEGQRKVSLSLSPPPPQDGVLFSLRLWIDVPSHLEDGFSCYLLNKIEL